MKAGIVYATGSKMIRRIILPDDDATLTNGTHAVGPGETMLIVDAASLNSHQAVEAAVQKATGVLPANPRCAQINKATNTVVAIIAADPAIDHVAGHQLVLSQVAEVGHTFDPAIGFTAPAYTREAYTVFKGGRMPDGSIAAADTLVPPTLVPAHVIPGTATVIATPVI